MNSRPLIIINPRSGQGMPPRRWNALSRQLQRTLGAFDSIFTRAPADARRIAHDESLVGRGLIIALGGDGTISEVADGILRATTASPSIAGAVAMGILPNGTGSDLARSLSLPPDILACARRLRDGTIRPIDAARTTFLDDTGRETIRHFINVASLGLSAAVARRLTPALRRLPARLGYVVATLKSLLNLEACRVHISIDDHSPLTRTLTLAAIANAQFFGGAMRIGPRARLDDGQLDLVTIAAQSRLSLLFNLPRVYTGSHIHLASVSHARCRSLHIAPADQAARIPLELDGEPVGHLPAHFELLPSALRLRC